MEQCIDDITLLKDVSIYGKYMLTSYSEEYDEPTTFELNSYFNLTLPKEKRCIFTFPSNPYYYDYENCCITAPEEFWQKKISFKFYNREGRYNLPVIDEILDHGIRLHSNSSNGNNLRFISNRLPKRYPKC